MKLIFLGSGSAFTVRANNYQSNMLLINEDGRKLLIDCGTDIRFSLEKQGFSYLDVHDVFISHLHADHAGGLEWLGLTSKADKSCKRPRLHLGQSMLDNLWNNVMSAGMSILKDKQAGIDDFFEVYPVEENHSFEWSGINFYLVQSIHIMNGYTLAPCYGLIFTVNGLTVYITADSQFNPRLYQKVYEQADIIFHDCETTSLVSGVHSRYEELCTLDLSIKQKMWLYHYNPGELPDAKADGFLGFVECGQVFDFDQLKK